MGVSAIFPNAAMEKLEGTVLIGSLCGLEAKPLVAVEKNSTLSWRLNCSLGISWATQR